MKKVTINADLLSFEDVSAMSSFQLIEGKQKLLELYVNDGFEC